MNQTVSQEIAESAEKFPIRWFLCCLGDLLFKKSPSAFTEGDGGNEARLTVRFLPRAYFRAFRGLTRDDA